MRSDQLFETTLGSVCEQQGGAIQTGPFGSQLHASDYSPRGTPVVMPADIIGGRIATTAIARVSDEHVDRLSQHKLQLNDIVFSRRGDVTRFARVTAREVGWLCGTGCLKVRVGTGRIASPQWIALALGTPEVKEWLVRHAIGATMPNLNTSILSSLPIKVPPLDLQHEAVGVCRALDDRIDLLRQTNATLEAIAQSLFKSWFIDFDPVRAKAEGREPEGMDAETAALFPDAFEESELGLVPKGWSVERVRDHLQELFTGRRPKGGVGGIAQGVPSIGAESIQGIGVFDYGKVKYVPEDFYGSMKSGKPKDFDVLLYKDGGKPGHFMPRMAMFGCGFPFARYCINEHVFGIRFSEGLGQPYGYFWIRQERVLDLLRGLGNKAAIPGINRGDVEGLPILVPSKSVTRSFNVAVYPLIERILLNAKKASGLMEIRDTLLPRLISGKLRLPEAQEQVEETLA